MRTPSDAASFSARRRARYSRRSHSSGSRLVFAIRPCQIPGIVSRARPPRVSGSTGTLRQSATWIPTVAAALSKTWRPRPSHSKSAVTAKSPPSKRCGTWMRRPAPSPLFPSASSPPRWASRARAPTPSATASCPASGVDTNPIPQAARPLGRSPGQARRVGFSAGGTGPKATGGCRSGLVRRYQKRPGFVSAG